MARSPKKKAAPAKKSGKTAFGRQTSETERKAVQKAPRSPFRGASDTERKAASGAQKDARKPSKAVQKSPPTRQCRTCRLVKPREDYRGPDGGLYPSCSSCRNEREERRRDRERRETERERKPPKKAPKKAPKAPKVVRDKRGRVRDYAAEYQRRLERAAALQISKSVARGHPKRALGEVGRAELRDLRSAARVDSPGDQRRNGVKRPRTSALRAWARERIAELAGVDSSTVQTSTDATRRGTTVEQFAAKFVELGLGTISQAYHLWFSP